MSDPARTTATAIICHCLCYHVHPDHRYICQADTDVILVEMAPNPYARVVPMCHPCRAALYQRTAGRQG